ncbi:replication protein A 14 kDa subunit A [Lucilia sericata]|uniref:replication protein A 14 kDa subunit A n=1 Tax=Lucilia sericata TaxID=13632 RepID=UPI0018A84964|nr:replication protein A 14 kDa subunit A [Lucilia sericata]XP_037828163.1 replication protein A 14 kDa subunit A [Lucilia sericata]XP_037828164.1 replication protein A 14 kDa subunit A [Lucilia sericata]XP_037828166.1 replication protein A 14 kDa subunit A [Lucilia sericata]
MSGTFEPRTLINGNMLRTHLGQNISIMLCVEDEAGTNLTGISTDDQKITVSLSDSVGAAKGDWIEVIGKAAGPSAIRASEAILFGGENVDFDKEGYNMMVSFMNNCKEIYRHG